MILSHLQHQRDHSLRSVRIIVRTHSSLRFASYATLFFSPPFPPVLLLTLWSFCWICKFPPSSRSPNEGASLLVHPAVSPQLPWRHSDCMLFQSWWQAGLGEAQRSSFYKAVVADFKKENQGSTLAVSAKSCGWYLRLNQHKRARHWTRDCLGAQAACLLPKQTVN